MCHLYWIVYNVHKSLLIMCKCFFMSFSVTLLSLGCDVFVFMTQKTVNFLLPFLFTLLVIHHETVLMLLFLLFCLSQAAPFQRRIRHAHGVVPQRHQRLRLRLPHPGSLSERRPLSGKALLFGLLVYLKGFDPPCVAFTTDEMASRRDEDSVCHLTKTRYWWADIVT